MSKERSLQEPLGESLVWLQSSLHLFLKSNVPFHPDFQNKPISIPDELSYHKLNAEKLPGGMYWCGWRGAESLSPAQAATDTRMRTAVSAASAAQTAPTALPAVAALLHPPPGPHGLLPTEGLHLQVLEERVGVTLFVPTPAGGPPHPGPLSVEGTPPPHPARPVPSP